MLYKYPAWPYYWGNPISITGDMRKNRQMIAHAQMSLPNFRRTLFTISHANCQSITTAENVSKLSLINNDVK